MAALTLADVLKPNKPVVEKVFVPEFADETATDEEVKKSFVWVKGLSVRDDESFARLSVKLKGGKTERQFIDRFREEKAVRGMCSGPDGALMCDLSNKEETEAIMAALSEKSVPALTRIVDVIDRLTGNNIEEKVKNSKTIQKDGSSTD